MAAVDREGTMRSPGGVALVGGHPHSGARRRSEHVGVVAQLPRHDRAGYPKLRSGSYFPRLANEEPD